MIETSQLQQLTEYMGLQGGGPAPTHQENMVSEESRIAFEKEMTVQDASGIELEGGMFPNEYGEDLSQRLFNGISDFDQEYQATMDKLQNYPSYKGYLEQAGIGPTSQMQNESSGHVSNIPETSAVESVEKEDNVAAMLEKSVNTFEENLSRQSGYYTSALTYQQESTQWFLSTQFWASKVKVLTSAVSQLTNNVRTLFTSQ